MWCDYACLTIDSNKPDTFVWIYEYTCRFPINLYQFLFYPLNNTFYPNFCNRDLDKFLLATLYSRTFVVAFLYVWCISERFDCRCDSVFAKEIDLVLRTNTNQTWQKYITILWKMALIIMPHPSLLSWAFHIAWMQWGPLQMHYLHSLQIRYIAH